MTTSAMTHRADPDPEAMGRLVAVLAEDAIFALAAGGDPGEVLDGLGKRRTDAYSGALTGEPVMRMTDQFDGWLVQMTRALAPVEPPMWMPMMEVIREKVTLEIGARGLRSLFSSKPSDKEVQRVKKLGSLTVRVLRAVFVADGNIDREEATTIASVIAALGLPETESTALYNEPTTPIEAMDVYGEIDPALARAIVRGAWLAAAWDAVDPREEHVINVIASKLSVRPEEVEAARSDAIARVDARRRAGLATVDGVRFVLADRVPGLGVTLAALSGTLMLPRRYREEALAQVGHGAPVTLARRYVSMSPEERIVVLGIVWAAALSENPTLGRRALLRARWERFAHDLGDDSGKPRAIIDAWMGEMLANAARNLK